MLFQIGTRTVGDQWPCFVIAEIGQNHQGDLELAKRMIWQAKECGADCVKFQKSHLPSKFTQAALARPYSGPNAWAATYGAHKEHLEFTITQYQELQAYADQVGIMFTASAMDAMSLRQLDQVLGVPFIKIGSGDANNIPMLRQAARMRAMPLVISTGMQTAAMVERIVKIMAEERGDDGLNIALLHCVSAYPTASDEVGLRMLHRYREEFPGVVIGYSGHERGVCVSLAAVAMGAKVLERHFTLDPTQKGTDHQLSLTPHEFTDLTQQLRQLECVLQHNPLPHNSSDESFLNVLSLVRPMSDADKIDIVSALRALPKHRTLMPCERECFDKLGKSLVYAQNLQKGHMLCEANVCFKVSYPKGLLDADYDQVIGAQLTADVSFEDPVQWEQLGTVNGHESLQILPE